MKMVSKSGVKSLDTCHGSSLYVKKSYLEDIEGSWLDCLLLEDGVILDIMDHHYIGLFTCVPNFSSLAWLEVYQEPPSSWSHTWMTLMVSDWRLEEWGHLWRPGSSWQNIMKLSQNFCEVVTSFGWFIRSWDFGYNRWTDKWTDKWGHLYRWCPPKNFTAGQNSP